jgi:hypothetical protein
VLAVGVAQLADWQRLPFEPVYAELMVFTACRIWRFAIEGTHSSKTEAAEWVRGRRPDLVAAGSALRGRRGGTSPTEDAVRELLAAALSAAVMPRRRMSPDLVQGQRPEGTGAGG